MEALLRKRATIQTLYTSHHRHWENPLRTSIKQWWWFYNYRVDILLYKYRVFVSDIHTELWLIFVYNLNGTFIFIYYLHGAIVLTLSTLQEASAFQKRTLELEDMAKLVILYHTSLVAGLDSILTNRRNTFGLTEIKRWVAIWISNYNLDVSLYQPVHGYHLGTETTKLVFLYIRIMNRKSYFVIF